MERARAKLPLWREAIWMVPGTFALMLFAGVPVMSVVHRLAGGPSMFGYRRTPPRASWAIAFERYLALPLEASAGLTVAAVVFIVIARLWWRDRHEALGA